MSHVNALSLRFLIALQTQFAHRKNELGQSTSEYGVVILVAIALGMAVLALFTSGGLDSLLHGLIAKALTTATGMVK